MSSFSNRLKKKGETCFALIFSSILILLTLGCKSTTIPTKGMTRSQVEVMMGKGNSGYDKKSTWWMTSDGICMVIWSGNVVQDSSCK